MARRLSQISGSPFTIFLNNYFINILLFRQLRKENIGAVKIIKSENANKEFLVLFTILKESFAKKLS